VGKEQIVGLLIALRLFVAGGDEVRAARWQGLVGSLVAALEPLPHVTVTAAMSPGRPVPVARLSLDEAAAGIRAVELARRLQAGDPPIHVNPVLAYEGVLLLNPMCLRESDVESIAGRLRALLAG
jgi:L-seryl-tRNA(Ser) seleniumtransferase